MRGRRAAERERPSGWDDWLAVTEVVSTADDVVAVTTGVAAAKAVTAVAASTER